MTFVNTDPRAGTHLPNGGVGKSGYGRECGMDGFREFANVKLYYVN
jgi:acyl-CoA reductase-like NAD-dependent aldehyde dehydrogenase